MIGALGEHGGRTTRRLNVGDQVLSPGTELDAKTLLGWPIRNRMALKRSGKVLFYDGPTVAASGERSRKGRKRDQEVTNDG